MSIGVFAGGGLKFGVICRYVGKSKRKDVAVSHAQTDNTSAWLLDKVSRGELGILWIEMLALQTDGFLSIVNC